LSVITRSIVTPWLAKNSIARGEELGGRVARSSARISLNASLL
jgi:hypothetical protein